MDSIKITGGNRLFGEIPISGAKNAALPLMIAGLLSDRQLVLENVPRLSDVRALARILGNHGVDITIAGKRRGEAQDGGDTIVINAASIIDTCAPYDLVSTMRASSWVVGPLVSRMGEARVSLPGGCAIGTRPVDLHIMALERLGAKVDIEQGYMVAKAPSGGLKGAEIPFPMVTVGGTHVALMAAALANGKTVIHNAAREPEVVDLAECLNSMGAKIKGAGTSTLEISGVSRLNGTTHAVVPDRIEAGTYAMAAAMAGGDVLLRGARAEHLQAALDVLVQAGAEISSGEDGIRVVRGDEPVRAVNVTTRPFPGFPTDLQAQFMALMTMARGESHITETIFENRFMHVQELARLGARIRLAGDLAIVEGVDRLKGAPVMATDLRASVSLVIAGLAAEGQTTVNRVYHLDRGFEALEKKLSACGAQIERVRAG